MKIGNISSTAATSAINGDWPSAAQNPTSTTTTTVTVTQEDSTQVDLSPEATMLSQASDDPSFDTDKVEAIAQAIRDGRFTIDPGAIADKLIANSQELLGSSSTLN
jgi:negative regulator of flagellin synthesis FlgM